MTDQHTTFETPSVQEEETLLEVYRQRYEQLRHVEGMRAVYFNLYVAMLGFGIAAVSTVYAGLKTLPPATALALSGLVWVMSIVTMMRAERWGGHISHDTCALRRIQNVLSSRHKTLRTVIPMNPQLLKSVEFDRPLWSRNRSVETPVSMLVAFLSALYASSILPFQPWGQVAAGFLLVLVPILLWRGEVSHLKRRHSKCCLS